MLEATFEGPIGHAHSIVAIQIGNALPYEAQQLASVEGIRRGRVELNELRYIVADLESSWGSRVEKVDDQVAVLDANHDVCLRVCSSIVTLLAGSKIMFAAPTKVQP